MIPAQWIRNLGCVALMCTLTLREASALRPGLVRSISGMHLQERSGGASLGKPFVPPEVMAGLCLTMVSPHYPASDDHPPAPSTVVVQAVVWKSGKVTPMRVIAGDPWLQAEAMNTVRLWRFKPFAHDGDLVDVSTELKVYFDPNKQGGLITHPGH
jgi:protein TonB